MTFKEINNYTLIIFVLLLLGCGVNATNQDVLVKEVTGDVGQIDFDKSIDDPDFKICNEKKILQYYNFGKAVNYQGEKIAIRDLFLQNFSKFSDDQNGYITIRFIVNCEGVSGRFRIYQFDSTYKPYDFDPKLISQLLSITRSLDGWKPGILNDLKYDYYQYLTKKIENGTISHILP